MAATCYGLVSSSTVSSISLDSMATLLPYFFAFHLSKAILDKQKKEEVNFTRIIMRFPKIHLVFDRIINTFEKYLLACQI